MNVTNTSTPRLDLELSPLEAHGFVTLSHAVSGCIAFLLNAVALCYIWRLQADRTSSFTVQMCFICVIDVGSGLVFSLRPIVTVKDETSATACACIFVGVVIFDTVSKGNMLCICIQRFIIARHLRTKVSSWRRLHSIAMALANVTIAICVVAVFAPMLDATKKFFPMSFCNMVTIRKQDGPNTFGLLFMTQVAIILASDVVCLVTIKMLKDSANTIHPAGVSSTLPSHDSGSNSGSGVVVRKKAHRRQQHAVMTILIILVVFNLSYIPITVITLFSMAGYALDPTAYAYGTAMLVTLLPCFVNPVLIATRMQDIQNMIKSDLRKCVSCVNNN